MKESYDSQSVWGCLRVKGILSWTPSASKIFWRLDKACLARSSGRFSMHFSHSNFSNFAYITMHHQSIRWEVLLMSHMTSSVEGIAVLPHKISKNRLLYFANEVLAHIHAHERRHGRMKMKHRSRLSPFPMWKLVCHGFPRNRETRHGPFSGHFLVESLRRWAWSSPLARPALLRCGTQ